MRRATLGAAAGVVLALAAASGVSAAWHAQQTVELHAVRSGDLSVTAVWRDGAPAWSPLYPGQRTPDTVIRVASQGAGDTLRWRLRVSSAVAPAFAQHVTFQAWHGACGTGTPIPAAGIGAFRVGETVDVCIRYTLGASAPGTLQGQGMAPAITVSAEQVMQ